MPIKAIFFDMDGTLVHMPGSEPREWLMGVYASFVEWNRLILNELGVDGDVKSLAERVQNTGRHRNINRLKLSDLTGILNLLAKSP